MDTIRLPLVFGNATIDGAISRMKLGQRAGIVIQHNEQFRVLTAGAILAGKKAGMHTLSQISMASGQPVHYLTPADIALHQIDTVQPLASQAQAMALFGHINPHFIVITAADDSAMLITRSEEFSQELSAPSECYCTGPRQHRYPAHNLPAGGMCYCGNAIVCDQE
jgi:hypothetical protein